MGMIYKKETVPLYGHVRVRAWKKLENGGEVMVHDHTTKNLIVNVAGCDFFAEDTQDNLIHSPSTGSMTISVQDGIVAGVPLPNGVVIEKAVLYGNAAAATKAWIMNKFDRSLKRMDLRKTSNKKKVLDFLGNVVNAKDCNYCNFGHGTGMDLTTKWARYKIGKFK